MLFRPHVCPNCTQFPHTTAPYPCRVLGQLPCPQSFLWKVIWFFLSYEILDIPIQVWVVLIQFAIIITVSNKISSYHEKQQLPVGTLTDSGSTNHDVDRGYHQWSTVHSGMAAVASTSQQCKAGASSNHPPSQIWGVNLTNSIWAAMYVDQFCWKSLVLPVKSSRQISCSRTPGTFLICSSGHGLAWHTCQCQTFTP